MSVLAETVVSLLHCRASMHSGRVITLFRRNYFSNVFEEFVKVIDMNSGWISQGSRIMYLQLFLISYFDGTLICSGVLVPKKLLGLLCLTTMTPGQAAEVQLIFADLRRVLPLYNCEISNLLVFMRQSEGFLVLIKIASIEVYTLLAVELITDILQVASRKIFETAWDKDS
ncbi:hypothetical protein RhiJN_10753 [Ceratobasidium sp. AG-Ba]|nr:hypothetical protein RhiJN_10753 [Ceratobasidium sp. AG-Ba]QRW11500.1 hypothetical protein RhiLY_10499 [Ceratobasidium sp. AG-Ba]